MSFFTIATLYRLSVLTLDVPCRFYKEELAGETENYVHIRANYENKAPLHVLQDIADETVDAWARVSKVVAGKGMVEEVWNELVQGYWYVLFLTYLILDYFLTMIQCFAFVSGSIPIG